MAEYSPTPAQRDVIQEILVRWEKAKAVHSHFVRRFERGERAYRGVLSIASDAAKWRHKLHPPYAFNLLETVVANTIDMGLKMSVRPAPHANIQLDEAIKMAQEAEAVEDLLRHEYRIDEMDFKQRPLFLCDSIGGMGVGKSYWNWTEGAVRRQGIEMSPVHDEQGNIQLYTPTIKEIVTQGVIRDHSTTEVVDPRDFVLHESAKTLQPYEPGGAQYLFHRCWYSIEQLKMMEAAGFVQDVDYLQESRDQSHEYSDRETELFNINRTKDLIEVLEYWCMKNGTVHRALVGNRKVLLRDMEDSPFWHGGYPFFICSSTPGLFSPRGFSDIELIEQLQIILWELMNQRLDNLELINNAIFLIRSDIDDPDAFEWFPGAKWPVDSVDQVQSFQPPYQLAEVSLHAEALLKGDLQNVTSAVPFAGGAETASVDQKTATGASIVMNAAQQRLVTKKYQAQQGFRHEANMRLKNCQQFITDTRLVHIVGEDGVNAFREISPLDIQGEYVVELEPMGESQMRQERRAEATQLTQVLLQAAPLAAAAGVPMNVREVLTDMLKKWGIEDADRFFSVQPQAAGAMGAGPAGAQPAPGLELAQPGAGPPQNPLSNLGVTAGSAVDASKPSAAGGMSGSPVVALQRALALSGGARGR